MSTIMVVDDMAVFREPIAAALRSKGFKTMCAADGREALDSLADQQPDLILLDIAMPVMDGLEFLSEWSKDKKYASCPVVLLTAVSERDYIVKAGKMGVKDYMLKSNFSLNDLWERIGKCLKSNDAPDQPNDQPDALASPAATAATAAAPAAAPAAAAESMGIDPRLKDITSLKQLKPVMKRSEVQEYLDHYGELKALSPTVAKVLDALEDRDCTTEMLATIIEPDDTVALRLVKLANSQVYNRGEPADSVHKAIKCIGIDHIAQTVINISVIDRFSWDNDDDRLNTALFWEHSIACGMIAAELVRSREGSALGDMDSAFTIGLLHDIGRMVYADIFGDDYTMILDAAELLSLPLEQVESRLLLINHADAMDRILHTGRFERTMINPIAFHHLSAADVKRMSPNGAIQALTLALSNRLAHAMLLGSSGNLTLYPTDDFVSELNLDPAVIHRLEQEMPIHVNNIKYGMLGRSDEDPWPSVKDNLKAQFKAPFKPLCCCLNPQTDAVRIFCDRLTDTSTEGPPNIAIVHLPHDRRRIALSKALLNAETKAGVAPLPVIVLSPEDELTLDASVTTGRPVEKLPFPVTLPRLIEAVNNLVGNG